VFHQRLVITRRQQLLRGVNGHGSHREDVRAEGNEFGRLAGFAVRDGLDERDTHALSIERANKAEAGSRQSDAPAGRGNEDGRRQRFLRSRQE
jgi:hypothetical protein